MADYNKQARIQPCHHAAAGWGDPFRLIGADLKALEHPDQASFECARRGALIVTPTAKSIPVLLTAASAS